MCCRNVEYARKTRTVVCVDQGGVSKKKMRLSSFVPDRLWRSDSPSETNYHLRAVDDESDRDQRHNLLDLVMRMSELALATGASASEATAMALRIMGAYRIRAHIDITNTAVTLSRPGGPGEAPITALRTVKSRVTDYSRLSRLEVLAERLSTHEIDPRMARLEFDALVIEPRQYRWWVTAVASAAMGASISILLGGHWPEMILSIISIIAVCYVLRLIGRLIIPDLFVHAIASLIPTLIAVLVMWWSPFGFAPSPAVVVGASIVFMLAGLSLVSSVRDGLDGYYLTSSARAYEAFLCTTGLVLGVTAVLYGALALGIPTGLNPAVSSNPANPIWTIVAGAIMASSFAIQSYAYPRAVVVCGFFGAISQASTVLLGTVIDTPIILTGVSAALVAAIATYASPRWHIPNVAMVSSGIIPLVPGSIIYRGIYSIVNSQSDPQMLMVGAALIFRALLIGIALAIGVSLGNLVARPFVLPDDKAGRLALLRSWRRGASSQRSAQGRKRAR